MSRVFRADAFTEVVKTMDSNPEVANQMYNIIVESLAYDKINNTYSEYIELKSKKEENLFKNIIIKES